MSRVKYLLLILSDNDPEKYTQLDRELANYLNNNTTMKNHTYRRYKRGERPFHKLELYWAKAIWEWMVDKFDKKLYNCTDGDTRAKLEHEYPMCPLHLFYGVLPMIPNFKKQTKIT